MTEVKIVRRWGSHQPGEVVDLDEAQAAWLVGIHFAEDPDNPGTSRHGTGAPGGDGRDQRAGGDPTRRRMTSARSSRVEKNLSGRVQGAPQPVGDVTHVADENLGREHKAGRHDVLRASGKTTSDELADQQREHDREDRERQQDQQGQASGGQDPNAGPEGRTLSQPKR